jgi:hypothetical protein
MLLVRTLFSFRRYSLGYVLLRGGQLVLMVGLLRCLDETLVQLGKGSETTTSFTFPATFDAACASVGQSTGP